MMQGKSSLNAYAVPYIPISKKSCIGESIAANNIVGFSGKSEDIGVAAGCDFSGIVSLEQRLEKLHVSDETYASEKLSMTDDFSKVDFLMWRFHGYCLESLADFLKFNNGDLFDTIDFLEEFETDHHTESPGTSEARHGAGPASPNSYSKGDNQFKPIRSFQSIKARFFPIQSNTDFQFKHPCLACVQDLL